MRAFIPLTLLISLSGALAMPAPTKRATDFVDPQQNGGQMGARDGGVLEPFNIIVSANSSPDVLTDDGFQNYMKSLGLSIECLGLHGGGLFTADLGDGNGARNQTLEMRKDFGVSFLGLGTCAESLFGGNHLRMFRQDGPNANTGALFLAVSQEKDLKEHHTVDDDGYNKGRDLIVSAATDPDGTSHDGVKYKAVASAQNGLLTAGTTIDSLPVNHGVSQDGVVQMLTVTIQ